MLQVVAANREVEATNAKRAEESERSLLALRQKGAGDYSKQVIQIFKPANLLLVLAPFTLCCMTDSIHRQSHYLLQLTITDPSW